MDDLCLLCDFRSLANEAKARADEVYADDSHEFGVHVFIIPKGEKPDVRLRWDQSFGPQRKAWYCEIPEKCSCGSKVPLKQALTWKPDPSEKKVEEPVFDPAETRERLSLL